METEKQIFEYIRQQGRMEDMVYEYKVVDAMGKNYDVRSIDGGRKFMQQLFINSDLYHNGELIESRKDINSFPDLVKLLSKELFKEKSVELSNDILEHYERLLPKFKDSSKGILLIGAIGVGKTCMMKVFQFAAQERLVKGLGWFRIENARHFVKCFARGGYDDLVYYTAGNDNGVKHLCIDELGLDNGRIKQFGNDVNVLAEVIYDRYDTFVNKGYLTHFTTNLTKEEIKTMYGDRVYDRLKQMCNVYEWAGNSLRK